MADNEKRALEFMAQAEKKQKSPGGFLSSLFGGSSAKVEEAAELYVRAGNSFKMAKKWAEAGNAFCHAADVQLRLQSKHEAATHYIDAGNCYKKSDPQDVCPTCVGHKSMIHANNTAPPYSALVPMDDGMTSPCRVLARHIDSDDETNFEEAVNCMLKAIEIYTDMGRFTIAAKHHINIAEIYETEMADLDKAVTNYEQAADYYKGEESNSSANKCLLKVAQYAAQQENYDKSIEIYEQVATSAMDNQLLRYSAKDYFFRAALCHMCRDIQDATIAVSKYEDMFPAFSDSRECKLVKVLLGVCEEQNVDGFTEAVRDYDSISRLDSWYTTMLLRIKKTIDGEPDLR